ncbi:MerR family DNA-binding protein [Chromobacterium sp. IIBBL 290-4]|uniref:MerR family DNA-binding protein n=1 Tax=Chromobacterium sp. IIBBL 290-4 TaxID=2953890 RepID=UPI003532564E
MPATALRIIRDAQRAGVSLDEIKQIQPADIRSWQHAELLAMLGRKVAEIESQQARLAHNKAHLQDLDPIDRIQTRRHGLRRQRRQGDGEHARRRQTISPLHIRVLWGLASSSLLPACWVLKCFSPAMAGWSGAARLSGHRHLRFSIPLGLRP